MNKQTTSYLESPTVFEHKCSTPIIYLTGGYQTTPNKLARQGIIENFNRVSPVNLRAETSIAYDKTNINRYK
jgi:hypothetical protein